jgi:hypothetical protein
VDIILTAPPSRAFGAYDALRVLDDVAVIEKSQEAIPGLPFFS